MLDLGKRTIGDSVSPLRPVPSSMVEASYDRLVDFALEQSHALLIAEDALGGPLGFVLLLDRLPDEVTGSAQGFIAFMAVEPAARRHGIGARLLSAAEDVARRSGLAYLALMVTEENEAARELYAQAGFTTERRLLCKPL
ncbi:MAG: GNAT family N-acetyltransferase [Candidatus Baltobacteraceae bacterium]